MKICPICGYEEIFCEIPYCNEEALYNGWIGSGLIKRLNVCEEHVKLTRGYSPEKVEKLNKELDTVL